MRWEVTSKIIYQLSEWVGEGDDRWMLIFFQITYILVSNQQNQGVSKVGKKKHSNLAGNHLHTANPVAPKWKW